MSTNASQLNARYSHRASMRAMWAIAALIALSYAGDEHIVQPFASGQSPAVQLDDFSPTKAESPSSDTSSATTKQKPVTEAKTIVTEAKPVVTEPKPVVAEVETTIVEDKKAVAADKAPVAEEQPSLSEGTSPAMPEKPAETLIVTELPSDQVEPAPNEATTKATIPSKDALETILARKGDLVLRDVTLAEWMMAIMDAWKVDLTFDPKELQKYTVTGSFTDRTLDEVLKLILTPNNLGYTKDGNGLSILPQEKIGNINLQQVNELITLEYSEPDQIEPTLKVLMSPSGKTQSIPAAKALMVIDLPENVEKIKKHISAIEQIAKSRSEKDQAEKRRQQAEDRAAQQGTPTADGSSSGGDPTLRTVFRPKFVRAADIQEAVAAQLTDTESTATVATVESENVLVVMAPRSSLESTAQLIRELDVPRRQVRISVKMYDISVDALEYLGFNWRNAGKDRVASNGVPNGLFDVHSAPLSLGSSGSSATSSSASTSTSGSATSATGTTGSTPFGGFITSAPPGLAGAVVNLYHVTRHFDISAVIQALDQTDGARLLADPTVMVYDLEPAEIRIVSEIPVQQLTQTDGGGSIGTTTFREAGITLSVTPEIADDQWMRLTVAPEFSALRGFSTSGQPIIDRRQETTKVLMMNGETLVLGGLRRRNEVEVVSGIPGLMNIKYLGNLFRSHRTNITESELLIFIHAEIMTPGCSMRPREQVASQVASETLDQLPHASHAPFIPPCNDPYCPYHNPRPRPFQGDTLVPGEWTPTNGAVEPPSNDATNKQYPAPLHGRTGRDIMDPPATMPPSTDASPEDFQPAPMRTGDENPPPVVVDPNARLQRQSASGQQIAMRRLPSVINESSGSGDAHRSQEILARQVPADSSTNRADRMQLPAGTDPKARIARSPAKRTTTTPSGTSNEKRSNWTGGILR